MEGAGFLVLVEYRGAPNRRVYHSVLTAMSGTVTAMWVRAGNGATRDPFLGNR